MSFWKWNPTEKEILEEIEDANREELCQYCLFSQSCDQYRPMEYDRKYLCKDWSPLRLFRVLDIQRFITDRFDVDNNEFI